MQVGGTASSTTVIADSSGNTGVQNVSGLAVSTTVDGAQGAANQIVLAGGTASGTTLVSGRYEAISSGGTDIGATISD